MALPTTTTTITTTVTSTVLLTVVGSDGNLSVNSVTGEVVSLEYVEDEDSPYHQIGTFDLAEWRAAVAAAGLPDTTGTADVDILCLGYWSEDGSYELPVHEYRAHCFALARQDLWQPEIG